MADLERVFHRAMLAAYETGKRELHYNATYTLRMIQEHGAVETARRLLRKEDYSEGMTRLWQEQRLDLSAEALVLRPEFAALFTAEERALARQILHEYGYTAPWDPAAGDASASPLRRRGSQ
jgi:hypothetical protein